MKIPNLLKNIFVAVLIGLTVSFVSTHVLQVLAIPPTSPYNPGETLNPNCAPGDSNCTVTTPAISGINADITALRGLNTQEAIKLSPFGTSAGNTGEIRFLELAAIGTNYIGFKAPDSLTTNIVWVLPNADGSANQTLITNGSGSLSWADIQVSDADLSAIAALAGTTGFLTKTAADTWALDTNTYITGNQTITLSGDISGSGTTSITAAIGAGKVTLAQMADMATASLIGRNTAATGVPEVLSASTARTLLGLVIGTNVQAYDADLTTYAGITPSANIQTFLGSADYAAARTNLGLAIGTNVQAYDADLSAIAALAGTTGFLTKTAADTWALDTNTYYKSGDNATFGTLGAGAITGTSFIIGANTLTTSEWANLDGLNQTLATTSSPTFVGLTLSTTPLTIGSGGTGTSTGSITGTSALTFAAGGTNQNVTLTPSGTGHTILNGTVGVGGIGTDDPYQDLQIYDTENIAVLALEGYDTGHIDGFNYGVILFRDASQANPDLYNRWALAFEQELQSIQPNSFIIQHFNTAGNQSVPLMITQDNLWAIGSPPFWEDAFNAKLNVWSDTTQLRLISGAEPPYNDAEFFVNSSGDLNISASGGDITTIDVFSAGAIMAIQSDELGNEKLNSLVSGKWTLGAQWSGIEPVYKLDPGTSTLSQSIANMASPIINGRTYRLQFSINFPTEVGGITPSIGGNVLATATTTGTFTYDFICTDSEDPLTFTPSVLETVTYMFYISLKEILGTGAIIGASLNATSSTGLTLGTDAATNTAGVLKLWSAGANNFYSTFTAGTQTANATYTLPTAMATANSQALLGSTAGVLSWGTDFGANNILTTGTLGAGAITGTSFIIGANTLNTSEWAYLDGLNQTLATTSSPTFANITDSGLTATRVVFAGTAGILTDDTNFSYNSTTDALTVSGMTFDAGSITDATGAISFGDENLTTTGTLGAGAITGTSFIIGANTLNTSEWAYLDGLNQTLATTSSPTFAGLISPINISSVTGVSLTAANGVLTMAGLGDGFDENLTLDFNTTTNQVGINSGTGVTTMNFNALNLTTTGTLGAGAITGTSLTDSGLTSGRISYASTAGLLVDHPSLAVLDNEIVGLELLTNGIFTGHSLGWTLAAGWTYNANLIRKDGDGIGTLQHNVVVAVAGQKYRLTYTISSWTVGTVTPTCGGVTLTAQSSSNTFTEDFTASTTGLLYFTPSNDARFYIDTVSLKQFTSDIVSYGYGRFNGGLAIGSTAAASTISLFDVRPILNSGSTKGLNLIFTNTWNGMSPTTTRGLDFQAAWKPNDGTVSRTLATLYGCFGLALLDTSSQTSATAAWTVTAAAAFRGYVYSYTGGSTATTTITQAVGFYADTHLATGVITTAISFYDNGQTVGGTNWGYYGKTINNAFEGNLRLSGTTVPTNALSLDLDDKIDFGDNAVYIFSDDDGHLDLTADTSIDLNGQAVFQYGVAAPSLNTNGALSIAYVDSSNRIYFYSNSGLHYINATAGFEIPNFETLDPISGEEIKEGDFVLGMINSTISDGALHGVWTKWDNVKKDLIDEIKASLDLNNIQNSAIENNEGFISSIKNALASFGVAIENGILQAKEFIIEKLTAKTARLERIEMVDQQTGDIYCTWIQNGEWIKIRGECQTIEIINNSEPSIVNEDQNEENEEPEIELEIPPTELPLPEIPAIETVTPGN